MTVSEFLEKDIDKFKECQTNESTKKIHIKRKKAKHGTEAKQTQMLVTLTEALAATDKG